MSYDKMLADELNISVNDLREAQANARSQFYRALADEGTLTDEQAAALESASIADIIHSAVGESDDNVVVDHILSKVAGALDMSTAELRDKLENGENLDQIAKDADVSESDLESKATDAISEIISNAEDAGLLSADEADKIREDLDQRVREFIGRTVGGSVTPPPTATPTPSN